MILLPTLTPFIKNVNKCVYTQNKIKICFILLSHFIIILSNGKATQKTFDKHKQLNILLCLYNKIEMKLQTGQNVRRRGRGKNVNFSSTHHNNNSNNIVVYGYFNVKNLINTAVQ